MSAERLYYYDSFLKRFSAKVAAVRELPSGGVESAWDVALDRTAFYPTSGGQPFDTGRLWVAQEGGAAVELSVDSVAEDEGGEVWHTVRQVGLHKGLAPCLPVEAGTGVECEIDWERRIDHMQQHSGQHLLSAVFLRELKAPTVSFHLGDRGSPLFVDMSLPLVARQAVSACQQGTPVPGRLRAASGSSNIDLACPPLSQEALERVELLVNRIIAEDRAVSARMVARSEAEALLEAGELRKLPERAGAIRLIEISECDRNACGGTHVRSTGQIGGLWLRGTEKISRGVRVSFVCGLRAVRAGRADAAVISQATAALSVGTADLPAAIERLKAEAKAASKERQRLRESLAEAEGARMAAETEMRDGLRLIEAECKDHDRDYVRLLAARAAAAAPATVAILSSGPVSGTTSGEPQTSRVVLARSADLKFDCGALMKEALAERGLRGGGSADLAQGEVAAEKAGELRGALAERVKRVISSQ